MPAKLVAIGDSLTQGFASGSICNTDLSYPALIANCMGLDATTFRRPNFRGAGGLPFNIEWLARRLEQKYGHSMHLFSWLRSIPTIQSTLDEVEDYWERGRGAMPERATLYHNLAVFGFEVRDAYDLTAGQCKRQFAGGKDDFLAVPSESRARTAYRVLNPSQDPALDGKTQLTVAEAISESEDGIENLILFLGANNCLGTVLELRYSELNSFDGSAFSDYTIWHPKVFEKDYGELVQQVAQLNPKNVFVATVPHVTIPPLTRGIMNDRGRLPDGQKYFDYYTRFWIKDKSFDPDRDPFLSGKQAENIDDYIDQYNASIRGFADEFENWHVVDLTSVLDDLAIRRNHGKPKRKLPDEISDLGVRFFELEPGHTVNAGSGIFSLDGIHPTTCGYGIIADEFMKVMRAADANIAATMRPLDWREIRAMDTLVSAPPYTLDDMFDMLGTLEKFFHMSRWFAKNPSTPVMPAAVKAVMGAA